MVSVESSRGPKAWLIRAGRNGEREPRALRDGAAILGWDEVGDISRYHTWNELKSAVRNAYPEVSATVVSNYTGQLWKFGTEIQFGDLVVMPLKTRADTVAIGRISGPYEFRPDEPAGFRQVRKVDWVRTDVAWDALRPDLRASLRSLLTVCGITRHDAAARIQHLSEHGTDPGFDGDEEVRSSAELLAEAVSADPSTPRALTIRSLLEHWGEERRTATVISAVKADLAANGLTTRPPFTEGGISEIVALVPLASEPGADEVTDGSDDVENVAEPEPMTRRLGDLPADLVSVESSTDLTAAKTTMLRHQFSQLAVIDADGTYHGAITWESIGQAHISRAEPTLADATVAALVVDHDALLLDQIDGIYDRGFIFVYSAERRVTGILTAADLTRQFGTLARPFVLIEEAENRLRRAVQNSLDLPDLHDAVRPHRKARIKSAADLTFGEYKFVLEDPARWRKVGWRLDRVQVVELVRQVGKLRNELMHFATDPLSDRQFAAVHGLLQLLRTAEPSP